MKRKNWIVITGISWLCMGVWLLYKGLSLISKSLVLKDSYIHRWDNPEQAATYLMAIGLLVGFLKGRLVLSKTVKRITKRIYSLQAPVGFKDAFPVSYWLLIGFMMTLGMGLKFLPISIDIKGAIDVAIGSALVNGAMLYFRTATYGSGSLSQFR
jgi:hypothetical protein